MKSKSSPVIAKHRQLHASFVGYLIGFLLSVYLTISAYLVVVYKPFSDNVVIALVIGFALMQFVVQALFFLHVGKESKPRWNSIMFGFMVMVAAIIVLGSIWIMANLDYRHGTTPEETNTMIIKDEGYKPKQ